jgi:hypothetical protein
LGQGGKFPLKYLFNSVTKELAGIVLNITIEVALLLQFSFYILMNLLSDIPPMQYSKYEIDTMIGFFLVEISFWLVKIFLMYVRQWRGSVSLIFVSVFMLLGWIIFGGLGRTRDAAWAFGDVAGIFCGLVILSQIIWFIWIWRDPQKRRQVYYIT